VPTNPSRSVEILGVKHSWRKFLQDNGFACPKACSFSPFDSKEVLLGRTVGFSFPLVVKPTDSSGSKGISIINTWEEFEGAVALADRFSRNKVLLIEEYIERGYPSVIGGDIFVWDGEVVLYGEMECLRDTLRSPLIPIGEKWPPLLTQLQKDRIHQELQRVVSDLGVRFGEMNVEILLDKEDNVHFLELGPRAGGNMIPIQLGDAFGVDLVRANVQAAMGIKPDFLTSQVVPNEGCYMHYVLHGYEAGMLESIEIDDRIKGYVYREVMYKKSGDEVEVFDNAAKALGIMFLNFPSVDEMEDFCRNHDSLIRIKLRNK
jgi:biotin carboxylase